MHVGTKYHQNALTLIESRSLHPVITEPTEGIIIQRDEDYKAKADLRALNRALDSIPEPHKVKMLDISYNSKLTKLPNIDRFTELEYLNIGARSIRNYTAIHHFKKIKSLFICNFKENSLSMLSVNSLKYFRAIRGRLSIIDRSIDSVLVQNCTSLKHFGNISICKLDVDGCHNIRLEEIPKIVNLKRLCLRGQKNIPGFEFLFNCPDLKDFVVTANNLSGSDKSALYDVAVPYIFLGVKNSLIDDIARINKKVIITNGDVTYRYGELQQNNSAYYDGVNNIT